MYSTISQLLQPVYGYSYVYMSLNTHTHIYMKLMYKTDYLYNL